jgi:intracellular septation protein A
MTEHWGVTGAVVLAIFLAWVWRPQGRVSPAIWLLLGGYALLGAWALWHGVYAPGSKEPAGFAFIKPTVVFWLLAIVIFISPPLGWGYPVQAIFGTYFAMSNKVWRWMNIGFGSAYALQGGINLLVAAKATEGNWDGFKYSIMMNLIFLVLLRLNFVWLDVVSRIGIHVYKRIRAMFP